MGVLMAKYALHPQIIRSTVDNKIHYIGYIELIQLYKLDYNDCIMWRNELNFNDYIHLYPKEDGDYTL